MAELTKKDVAEIVGRVVDEKIVVIKEGLAAIRAEMVTKNELAGTQAEMATKNELAGLRAEMATKKDLADLRAEMVTKDELTSVREVLISKIDQMEDGFKEDLAAQDARLTVRLERYFERALEVHDRKIMDTLRQAIA